MRKSPVITLTTDFGLSDSFVGAMKGVILSIAPDAQIVDISHAVRPQDILGGALRLEAAVPYFPTGAVHVAVVDPGVGSARRAIAVETEKGFLVGPDNGLFTAVLQQAPARRRVHLNNAAFHLPVVSATFHGRDIFAPAAAHLASGVGIERLGDPLDTLTMLEIPRPVARGDLLEIHVVCADHFGNLVTDLTAAEYEAWSGGREGTLPQLQIGTTAITGICRAYAEAAVGAPLACFGSGGRLEIAIRNGSARDLLSARAGDRITVTTFTDNRTGNSAPRAENADD